MTDQYSTLRQQFKSCQLKDIHRFRQRLDRLQKAKDNGEALAQLQADVAESVAAVQARQTLLENPINYPDLPVSDKRETLLETIRDNQVVVIAGETGSGKTTQLPKLCLELGLGCRGLIGHTQPRRLAARTVASRIAEELETELGGRVGYQVRFHDQISESTQVKLMTDGILLAETQRDHYLDQYEVLIIDEAHERSLNIDFLLGYIKRILPKRPDLKLIITSATIDVERFSKHFDDAPVVEVSGRTYPVDVRYRPPHEAEGDDERALDLQESILAAVEELFEADRSRHSGPGDILVFLPGEREIRETAEVLRKANLRDCEVIPLYARLSLKEQNRVFHGQRGAGRRIVLATNVAETSLTVPGIRYVIDPGLARISRYSYRSKVQRLPIEPVSQASANQRAGRCGRVAPGICIRLYSEDDFNNRPEFTDAEIRRTNLAAVILNMLQLKLGDISRFPFVDPPDKRFINDGYTLLEELGAVDGRRHITKLGRQLARLPVDPRIGRMVLEAARLDCLSEVLVIASALSVQDPRERPHDKRQAADEKHGRYADDNSDFTTLLNLWNLVGEQREALSQNQLRNWCQKNFLSFLRLREWRDVHRQLRLTIKDLNLKENSEPAEYEPVHKALLSGLLSHIGTLQEKGEYLGARNRKFRIFPASGLFKRSPKWVVAAELLETSKLYAHTVARIDPKWIEPLAGHLVKRSWSEPHWEQKRAQVVASEQVTLYGLIIVAARKVHYGPIDVETSHEIFIRSALVEGEYKTRAPFFNHNRQLLDQVETLEAKSRRRDLLVDEEMLYQFYAERMEELGGEAIVNGAGFENWRKQVEKENPKALFMTREDVLQRSTEHVSQQNYPDFLHEGGARLKLEYQFEPTARDDGINLDCPLPLLKALPEKRLEWLVPGLLEEKVAAVLKGLPKQERKHFVPVPEFAKGFCEAVAYADGDFYEQLARYLLRQTSHRVSVDLLKQSTLPEYLQINIRLKDQKGRMMAQSRSWGELNSQYGEQADQALQQADSGGWGRAHITTWDFGELPEAIETEQVAGLKVTAWPGLVDNTKDVELKLFGSAIEADESTRQGVARLLLLVLSESVKYARRSLKTLNEAVLLSGGRFDRQQLEGQVMMRVALEAIEEWPEGEYPRTAEQFEQIKENLRACFTDKAEAVAEFVLQLHRSVHRIQKKLNGRINLNCVPVLNDIRQQLDTLMPVNYLSVTPGSWLYEYPRYLQGIEQRLEKYQRDLREQTLNSGGVQQLTLDWENAVQKACSQNQVTEELLELRWWIEELRISLFAQGLGTRFTVSEKRFKKRLAELS